MKPPFNLLMLPVFFFQLGFPIGDRRADCMREGVQYEYSYVSEGISYSEIQRLYSTDTVALQEPFFYSRFLQKLEIRLKCRIKETIIRSYRDSFISVMEIVDPDLVLIANGASLNTQEICRELTYPVVVEWSASGKIIGLRIRGDLKNQSSNVVREILSRFQFVRADSNAQRWEVEEENTSGSFNAKYQLIQNSPVVREYQKTNLGYTKLKSPQPGQQMHVRSNTMLSTDSSGIIKGIKTSEAQIVIIGKDTITALAGKVDATLESVNDLGKGELKDFESLNGSFLYRDVTTLSAALSEEQIKRSAFIGTLGRDSLESLTKVLQALNGSDGKAVQTLKFKYKALAYLFPESCTKIAQLLYSQKFGSRAYEILSYALAKAGTKPSVDALSSVVRKRRGEEAVVMDLLPELAITTAPTDQAVSIAKELALDTTSNRAVTSTAQLVLGGLAFHFQKIDQQASDQLTSLVIDLMKTEPDTLQRVLVLGNTGSPAIFSVLRSYIENPTVSLQIRAAAITGCRFIKSSDAASLLEKLAGSSDAELAKAAKETIEFRKEYFEEEEFRN